jgi:phospholipase/carboxylesterase
MINRIDSDAVLWRDADTGRRGSPLLVLLHGVGSHEGDLFSFAEVLPARLTVASLRAPLPYFGDGASWFDLTPNYGDDTDTTKIAGSVAGVLEWLDTVGDDFSSVGLLGFSQGAATALQLVRTEPDRFRYVVALSGFVFNAGGENDHLLAVRTPRIPAFQGIGDFDLVIAPEKTAATVEWLPQHFDAEVHHYPIDHTVSVQELRDVIAFLERVA